MPGKTCCNEYLQVRPALAAASMRPQRNAGENIIHSQHGVFQAQASMRPQRSAGENRRSRTGRGSCLFPLQ